jgi:pimeloyl-ACP methyl ester carboxylesterase
MLKRKEFDMYTHTWCKLIKLAFLVPAFSILLSSCAFFELKEEIAEYEASYGLMGQVTESSYLGPIIVILYSEKDGQKEIVEFTLTDDAGYFSFIVQEGDYWLAAFEDRNYDFAYEEQELAGYYGAPHKIIVSPDTMASAGTKGFRDLNIQLSQTGGFLPGYPAAVDDDSFGSESFVKFGAIVDLDDKRFAKQKGETGYWKPLSFLRDIGIGVYFVEPYDPQKIPILFVHGAVGTPAAWKKIAENIDRGQYQPWFFYYPSGLRLERLGRALNNIITELHNRYGFKTLYVTAHSMGGLVSRSFILKNVYDRKQEYIKLFVSISTPWNGHRLSKKGVDQAPAVVPSWHDMVPDSEFIQAIYKRGLPSAIPYYLFFSFRGDCSMMMQNNDGAVELSSELDYRAQSEAVRTIGFNEDHVGILSSQNVIDEYNQILSLMEQERRRGIFNIVTDTLRPADNK